jgi:hypothetical protein
VKIFTLTITCETCKKVLATDSGSATEAAFKHALWKAERVVTNEAGVTVERRLRQTKYFCAACADGKPSSQIDGAVVPFPLS